MSQEKTNNKEVSSWKNGWNRATFLERIRERNGFSPAVRKYDSGMTSCVYRVGGEKAGRGCFVGVFIPDEMYSPEIDSMGHVEKLMSIKPELMSYMPLEIGLLGELQGLHDSQTPGLLQFSKVLTPEEMEARVIEFLDKHGLT